MTAFDLFGAIELENLDALKIVLDQGIDANVPHYNIHGFPMSPLLVVLVKLCAILDSSKQSDVESLGKFPSMISMLIDAGADPDKVYTYGKHEYTLKDRIANMSKLLSEEQRTVFRALINHPRLS